MRRGPSNEIKHMPTTFEAGGAQYRHALLVFFVFCAVAGIPFSWTWTVGRRRHGCLVGFALSHRSKQLGICQRRAAWCSRWPRETASATTEHRASSNKELGRIMFLGGALEYERPFLCPVLKLLNANTPALQYVESLNMQRSFSVIIRTKYPVASTTREAQSCDAQVAPRVGAQASGERTGIGGWYLHLRADGVLMSGGIRAIDGDPAGYVAPGM